MVEPVGDAVVDGAGEAGPGDAVVEGLEGREPEVEVVVQDEDEPGGVAAPEGRLEPRLHRLRGLAQADRDLVAEQNSTLTQLPSSGSFIEFLQVKRSLRRVGVLVEGIQCLMGRQGFTMTSQ